MHARTGGCFSLFFSLSLPSVAVVLPGVGDAGVGGAAGGGGGLNFSRVHGFTYVSHYTGPRLPR